MQDARFIIPNLSTEEQQKTVRELGVIVNVLGFKTIEVMQKDLRFKSCQGVKVCRFKKKMAPTAAQDPDPKSEYTYNIEGGQLSFIPNPYGAGNVVYLIDDEEPVPPGSKSGKEKGYNRDFLASHYGEKLFKIVDPEIDLEVKGRYENILKKLAEEKPERDRLNAKIVEKSNIEENKRKGVQSIAIVGQQQIALQPNIPGVVPPPAPVVDEEKERLRKENEELKRRLAEQDAGKAPAPGEPPAGAAPESKGDAPTPPPAKKKPGPKPKKNEGFAP